MKCRTCDSKNTRVICTEHYLNQTKRYCRCLDCGIKFRTIEQYEVLKPGPPKGVSRPGNIARGSQHGSSIFTEQDIVNMRLMHNQGNTLSVIATRYGISPSYTSKIVNRKAWTHV